MIDSNEECVWLSADYKHPLLEKKVLLIDCV